jgi:hypothetical protein
MQLRPALGPHKIHMRHTRFLVPLILAVPLCALAQNLEPCNYGLACLSPGGSPELVSPNNQLANIIQGKTDDTEAQPGGVHRCDGLVGNAWLACNYITAHGCRRPTWTDLYRARLDAETLRLVAVACGWK